MDIKKRIFSVFSVCCIACMMTSCEFNIDTIKAKFQNKDNEIIQEEIVQTAVVNEATSVYEWQTLKINGGGYVTGIVCSTGIDGLMYARTEKSGAFKYDKASQSWVSITDFLKAEENSFMSIESLVCDNTEPNRVYMVCGSYDGGNGAVFSSADYGETWSRYDFPFICGGDASGRACGERLAVDPNDSRIIYYGSRNAGLWKSSNYGKTWSVVPSFEAYGNFAQDTAEIGIMWVLFDKGSGQFGSPTLNIYVGVADVEGNTIYKSENGGISWNAIDTGLAGYYPVQARMSGNDNIYMIFNNNVTPEPDPGNGFVYSYNTKNGEFNDITPKNSSSGSGYGSIAVSPQNSNVIAVSTLGYHYPKDNIYISYDAGENWSSFFDSSADYFQLDFSSSEWIEKRLGNQLGSWITSICIDPSDSSKIIFATENGVFSAEGTDKLINNENSELKIKISDINNGLSVIEADDIVSADGKNYVLSNQWGGFAYENISDNILDFDISNSVDIDCAWKKSNIAVRCGEHGKSSMTPVLFTDDGGKTWYSTASLPEGYSSSCYNGTVAVSAEGTSFIWSPDDKGISPVITDDFGQTWYESEGLPSGAVVCADKTNNMKYYAVSENSFYSSSDGGKSFDRTGSRIAENMKPYTALEEGNVWLCGDEVYFSSDGGVNFEKINGVSADCMTFGKSSDGTSSVVYIAGTVSDKGYGIYNSVDNGKSWTKMSTDENIFGKGINEISADFNEAGRIYVATDGRGIITVK